MAKTNKFGCWDSPQNVGRIPHCEDDVFVTIENMSGAERFSVLIVDDESTVRDLLVTLFRSEGYEVGAVGSAAVALASVLDQSFDAVVTDIRMPRDNGLD